MDEDIDRQANRPPSSRIQVKGDKVPSKSVLSKFKAGKLRSGSKHGPKVKNRKQAVAIMLSEREKERGGKKKRATSRSRSRY
jgi:hypothetical protein